MTDLNSKIAATKEEVSALSKNVAQVQNQKSGGTLASAAQGKDLAALRAPPRVKTRRTLKGHYGKVAALHWAADSRTLASAGQDGNLLIWNAVTSNKIKSIPLKSSYVMSVGIEPNGRHVACGGLDNLCTVYSTSGGNEAPTEMASHDGFLSCCRFVSGSNILTSSGDSTCIYWDIPSHKPISRFTEHGADCMNLCLKPNDSNVFVSCSVDKTCKLWDIRAAESQQTYSGFHSSDINGVDFLPEGNAFCSASQDGTARIFDVRAYNQVAKFANLGTTVGNPGAATGFEEVSQGFTSITASKSGRLVFCGDAMGNINCFDVLNEREGPAYVLVSAHDRHISSVAVSPKGDAIASGSWDNLVKIWA